MHTLMFCHITTHSLTQSLTHPLSSLQDAGTYDHTIGLSGWPRCGGANGSLRFKLESSQGGNAGLAKAVNLLKHVKVNYQDTVSWADVIQMVTV